MNPSRCRISLALGISAILVPGVAAEVSLPPSSGLVFNDAAFTVQTATVEGRSFRYRAYEGLLYVKHPVDARFQSLNLYVPVDYYEGRTIGIFNAQTAPIFLPNGVGGYMPGPALTPRLGSNQKPNASLVALSRGCVVAAPAVRGRTSVDAKGVHTGKAPAALVDLKAAVRYLRANAGRFPGNPERIISNGTSAGGALSALLGATGNHPAFAAYLRAVGAAEARDDVFAVSAYCPITNLENADAAYEWQLCGVNDFSRGFMPPMGPPPGGAPGAGGPPPGAGRPSMPMAPSKGTLSPEQMAHSKALKALFPGYLNDLNLKGPDGNALTMNADGTGSFKNLVRSLVIASAQRALKSGADLSKLAWLTIRDGQVTDLDWDAYVRAMGRLKATAAFDGLDLDTGENSLFGSETVDARHFTAYGAAHGKSGDSSAPVDLVRLMNPMAFIGQPGATVASRWRIRHGSLDRDTSLAIPTILATRLSNTGAQVDFQLPWGQGHGGDYDLDELFQWIERICR